MTVNELARVGTKQLTRLPRTRSHSAANDKRPRPPQAPKLLSVEPSRRTARMGRVGRAASYGAHSTAAAVATPAARGELRGALPARHAVGVAGAEVAGHDDAGNATGAGVVDFATQFAATQEGQASGCAD